MHSRPAPVVEVRVEDDFEDVCVMDLWRIVHMVAFVRR